MTIAKLAAVMVVALGVARADAATVDGSLTTAEKAIGKGTPQGYIDAAAILDRLVTQSGLNDEQKKKRDLLVTKLELGYGYLEERKHETTDGSKIKVRLGCNRDDVLCVRGDTSSFGEDELPGWVSTGDAVTVRVIGCKETYSDATFEVSAHAVARAERLFQETFEAPTETLSAESVAQRGSLIDFCGSPDDMITLHQAKVEITDDPTKDRIRITATRKASKDGGVPEASSSYQTRIEHGRYFLDIGLMIPLVIGGDRSVVAVPIEQTPTDFGIAERSELLVIPAVVLNVFPGGRERGKISSFTGYPCSKDDKFGSTCKKHRRRRILANSLALQVGVDVDLRQFDRMFFGATIEPVAGLSIGGGVAVVKGDRLTEDTSPGRIITEDELPTFTRSTYMPHPYVGVTFSADIIRNLAGFRGRANK